MATIHQKLLHICELSNRAKVSRKAGFGDNYLNAVLARRMDISASSAVKLARALGLQVKYLIDDSIGILPVMYEPVEPAPAVEPAAREVAKEKKHRAATAA